MKSIETKYVGPSNVRGSRYIATDGDNRIIVSADDRLSFEGNHTAAAVKFCEKFHWTGKLQGGHTKSGMVFVWFDATYGIKV